MSTLQRRGETLIGRSYTRSRRFPRMFGRMPGRDGGYLPGGPYTLTQGVLFLVLLLGVWKFPPAEWLGPARWGVPLAAVFVRRARIESRTPLGWLLGLVSHLLAPATGSSHGKAYRAERLEWSRPRLWLHPTIEVSPQLGADETVSSPLQQLLARAHARSE